MSTLFPRTISFTRRTGGYVNGVWTDGTPATLSFRGSVQPTTGNDFIPEAVARRDGGLVKVYSDTALLVAAEGGTSAGDVVTWEGQRWEVVAEMVNSNGLINHRKYIAERRGAA